MKNFRKGQRGVALLTVLLVVVLATLSAVAMLKRQHIEIRRSANLLHGEQAYQYALGAEAWARRVLLRSEIQFVTLTQEWATQMPPTLVEGGYLSGYLEDRQGRFNLNNLLTVEGELSQEWLEALQRLFSALDISPDYARAFVDWMDADQVAQLPYGAEDEHYLLQETPYRSANHKLVSPTELYLLIGMEPESAQRLLPYICTLPEPTPVNVNSSSAELLQSLIPQLSAADAQTLVDKARQTGFESVQDFLQQPELTGLELTAELFSVKSEYFLLHARAEIGVVHVQLHSLLQRRGKRQLRVIRRSRSAYQG